MSWSTVTEPTTDRRLPQSRPESPGFPVKLVSGVAYARPRASLSKIGLCLPWAIQKVDDGAPACGRIWCREVSAIQGSHREWGESIQAFFLAAVGVWLSIVQALWKSYWPALSVLVFVLMYSIVLTQLNGWFVSRLSKTKGPSGWSNLLTVGSVLVMATSGTYILKNWSVLQPYQWYELSLLLAAWAAFMALVPLGSVFDMKFVKKGKNVVDSAQGGVPVP